MSVLFYLVIDWDSPAVFLTFLFLAGTGYLLSFTSCVSLFLEGEFARHRRNAWQSTTFHSSFLHWFHSCWWVLSCWWINLSLVLSFSCLNIGLGLEDQRTTIPFKDRASSKKCLPEKKKTAADSSSLIRLLVNAFLPTVVYLLLTFASLFFEFLELNSSSVPFISYASFPTVRHRRKEKYEPPNSS